MTDYKWNSLDSNFLAQIKMIATTQDKYNNTECALLLKDNGEVFAVGKNDNGCLGPGVSESSQPIKLEELYGVAGVSVCGVYGDALAYTKEGEVFVWGLNSRPGFCMTPVFLPQLSDIEEAVCIRGHYLALTKNGKVYEWRGNTSFFSTNLRTTPTLIAISEVIVNIACGAYHSLAVTTDGEVYIWGRKYSDGTRVDLPLSKVTFQDETVAKVACGSWYSLALTHSGKIFTWGYNDYRLGDAKSSFKLDTPVQVGESIGRFKDIAVNGWWTSAAATENGCIYLWGRGENDEMVTVPTLTQYTELQQFIAECKMSSFSWRCTTTAVESASYYSLSVESSAIIVEKLKNTFNNKESSDLTLMIDNKPIYVHRFVLSLRSDYFQTMLQNHWTDRNERKLKLSTYNFEVYKSYLWFLYSGEVVSTLEHLLELWTLADAFSEKT